MKKIYELISIITFLIFILFNFATFKTPSYLHNFPTEINTLLLVYFLSILYFLNRLKYEENFFYFIFIVYFFFFYILRILTLDLNIQNLNSFSEFSIRLPNLEKANITYALLNLILNFSFIAILLSHLNFNALHTKREFNYIYNDKFFYMIIFISYLKFYIRIFLGSHAFVNIFCSIFSDILLIYLATLIYLLTGYKVKNLLLYIITILPSITLLAISNSKSFLIQPVLIFSLLYFQIKGFKQITPKRIKNFIFCLLLIPCSYFLISNKILIEKASQNHTINISSFVFHLQSFFHRIGYLDFYLEKSLNPIYSSAFRFEDVMLSFFNKVTPFFDPFSNSHLLNRTLYSLNQTFPSWDGGEQITIFAEFFRYFGIYSFLCSCFFIIILYWTKFFFLKNTKLYMMNFYFIFIFWFFLDGFGLDYFFAINCIYPIIGFLFVDYIFSTFLIKKGQYV